MTGHQWEFVQRLQTAYERTQEAFEGTFKGHDLAAAGRLSAGAAVAQCERIDGTGEHWWCTAVLFWGDLPRERFHDDDRAVSASHSRDQDLYRTSALQLHSLSARDRPFLQGTSCTPSVGTPACLTSSSTACYGARR